MSKRVHKSLAYIVLVSFLALLTPKSLWHDCSHGQHTVTKEQTSKSKHSIHQGYEKCAVCDLHIPLLSTPLTESRITFHAFVQLQLTLAADSPLLTAVNSQLLRGPPVSMIA